MHASMKAHFANAQFWNIFMNCSVTIIWINAGIFLLFPIFQGASFNYHKPNIKKYKYFDFKGEGCFAKLQSHQDINLKTNSIFLHCIRNALIQYIPDYHNILIF